MKRQLIALFDRLRVDLNEATAALERGNVDEAIGRMRDMADRIHDHIEEIKSNDPTTHLAGSAAGPSTRRSLSHDGDPHA